MPVRSLVLLRSSPMISPQLIFAFGQSNCAATGSGMASTTGLRAIDVVEDGRKPDAAAVSRSSQVDESGTQASGTAMVPEAWPRPVRLTPCLPAMAAATSPGSAVVTSTATHTLSTSAPPPDHCAAAACTAGAISADAATVSRTWPLHAGSVSCRRPTQAPATTRTSATAAAVAPAPRKRLVYLWRPDTSPYIPAGAMVSPGPFG
jgi:hypothetical protein